MHAQILQTPCTYISYNPAANAKQSSIITYVGDTVTIVMYASALSPLSESDITWKLNDIIIENGDYQNTKRELTI